RQAGRRARKAVRLPTQSQRSRSRSPSADQSSQVSSLSWQYALLLPRWVRDSSSPAISIGTPRESSVVASRLRISVRRARRTAARGPVAFPPPVAFVAPPPIRHQVGEREAVVAGDVVEARRRPAPARGEPIARARDSCRQLAAAPGHASPVAAHALAEAVVPL